MAPPLSAATIVLAAVAIEAPGPAHDALSHWHLKQSPAWSALPLVGVQRVTAGCSLELRNCSCGSTLAVEVRTIPACRHCGGEGLVLDEREREVECGFCSGSGDATQAVVL